jgi:hypothetical protein
MRVHARGEARVVPEVDQQCRLTEQLKTAELISEGREPLADAEHEKSCQSS